MIIAFVAPKQYGKSTACNILKKYWGDDVVQVNFKDALITEIKQNFPDLLQEIAKDWPLTDTETIDDLFIQKPPLIRTLMQNYGTEVRRGDNQYYWINEWIKNILTQPKTKHILVDDVRFINESNAIKMHGGILIRLIRTDKTNTDTHQSETEQESIKCDYEITCNAGEFDKLETELLTIVKSMI